MTTAPAPFTLGGSTPEELSALLDGRSDTQIVEAASALGVDALLDRVFDALAQRFLPERARGTSARVVWNLETPAGRRSYQLRVASSGCSVHKGETRGARVTLDASIPMFLRIVSGRVNGLQAFASGALRVQGEQVLALAQQLWFDVDVSAAPLDISRPSQLAQLIRGRSDEEIDTAISVTGADLVLRKVLEGMVLHYLPHRGPRKRTVVTFSVRADDGDRVFQFAADPRAASYQVGEPEPAHVTLLLRFPTLLRVASGELDGIRALAQGRLRVRGSLLTARSVMGWFDLKR